MEDLNMSTGMFMRANGKMTRCATWDLCHSRLPSRQHLALCRFGPIWTSPNSSCFEHRSDRAIEADAFSTKRDTADTISFARHMARACTITLMARNMTGNGKKTNSMDKACQATSSSMN